VIYTRDEEYNTVRSSSPQVYVSAEEAQIMRHLLVAKDNEKGKE